MTQQHTHTQGHGCNKMNSCQTQNRVSEKISQNAVCVVVVEGAGETKGIALGELP